MKKYSLTLFSFSVISMLFAQNDNSGALSGDPAPINSPYHTSVVKDGLAIAGAVGVTALGYSLIKNKDDLTLAELATKNKDNLLFIDKGVAGNYSDRANKDSYILFNSSYAFPVIVALIDKDMRSNFAQLMVLYVETVGITGAMYNLDRRACLPQQAICLWR